jgi:hypothetical protein
VARGAQRVRLVCADARLRVRDLAVEIVERYGVLVDDAEVAEAGRDEVERGGAAEAAGADDERAAAAEALLRCTAAAAAAALVSGFVGGVYGLVRFDCYRSASKL